LKFEDVQACLGPLGPARESLEVLPFDPLDFRAKLSGLLTDPEGRVDMEWKLTVTDAGGETLLERSGRSRDPLGAHATSFPFFATVSLPDRPGRYKLTVAVEDHLSNQQTSFQRELIAKPLEFALVALRFFYDEAGHAPAPPGGVAGQVLYVQLKAVGFDRSAGQAEVAMTMQVFDEQGKPVLPKSITAEVSETSAEALRQATSIDFSARLPLERAGNYRLRITLHDRTGGQFVKQDVPLKVTAP
jgi:folate-binding Fe-S cluster repair protein YgfZ